MTERDSMAGRQNHAAGGEDQFRPAEPLWHAPFLRAPEASRSIFLVISAAACGPLAAGVVFFGWRALIVAGLSVAGCALTETAYYRVTRTPALLGRSHAALTGLLLALTLPPFVPWYVPLTGALFAIIVGKAIFGGVGHFLWQPALVGRLAVAVIFAPPLFPGDPLNPPNWPVLARSSVILGDVRQSRPWRPQRDWRSTPAPLPADAHAARRPRDRLRDLTQQADPPPRSIVHAVWRIFAPRADQPPPSVLDLLRGMPPAWDLLCGAHGGGIGETCVLVILLAGLYLVYRNYVRGHLPGLFILAAAAAVAVAPVQTAGAAGWRWLPVAAEGAEVGITYVAYQLASGELMLAAWFLATEMTSRPVTARAQAVFAVLCGSMAMLFRLYLPLAIPAYAAVLVCNTFTPALDAIRPRVLGQKRLWQRLRRSSRPQR